MLSLYITCAYFIFNFRWFSILDMCLMKLLASWACMTWYISYGRLDSGSNLICECCLELARNKNTWVVSKNILLIVNSAIEHQSAQSSCK